MYTLTRFVQSSMCGREGKKGMAASWWIGAKWALLCNHVFCSPFKFQLFDIQSLHWAPRWKRDVSPNKYVASLKNFLFFGRTLVHAGASTLDASTTPVPNNALYLVSWITRTTTSVLHRTNGAIIFGSLIKVLWIQIQSMLANDNCTHIAVPAMHSSGFESVNFSNLVNGQWIPSWTRVESFMSIRTQTSRRCHSSAAGTLT